MTRWIGAAMVGMLLQGYAVQAQTPAPQPPDQAPTSPQPVQPAPMPPAPPPARPEPLPEPSRLLHLREALDRAQFSQLRSGGVVPGGVAVPEVFSNVNVLSWFGQAAPYASGLNALQQRQYERAITQFDQVIASDDARADGALYWKAFAQHRLGRTPDALGTLGTLQQAHPRSRYLPDAKVLEAEMRRTSGQPLSLEELSATDDIKLLALNGLARTDPARAIPLIGEVLNAANSLAVKRRAIYVLALSEDERAHEMLLAYATGGNPDLQSEAIRYLATRRDGRTTHADLRRIYESTQDRTVRRAIIEAYRAAGDAEALVAIARLETNLDLQKEIVGRLSQMAPTSPAAADYLVEVLNR